MEVGFESSDFDPFKFASEILAKGHNSESLTKEVDTTLRNINNAYFKLQL